MLKRYLSSMQAAVVSWLQANEQKLDRRQKRLCFFALLLFCVPLGLVLIFAGGRRVQVSSERVFHDSTIYDHGSRELK